MFLMWLFNFELKVCSQNLTNHGSAYFCHLMDKLLSQIEEYKKEIAQFSATDAKSVEEFRIKWLGTKGIVKSLMGEMKNVAIAQKREFGQVMNDFKLLAENKYEDLKQATTHSQLTPQDSQLDLTLPGDPIPLGSRHPVS